MIGSFVDDVKAAVHNGVGGLLGRVQAGITAYGAVEGHLLVEKGDVGALDQILHRLIHWGEIIAAVALLGIPGNGVVEQVVPYGHQRGGGFFHRFRFRLLRGLFFFWFGLLSLG